MFCRGKASRVRCQVAFAKGKGLAMQMPVVNQKTAAAIGHLAPLVEIKGQGVDPAHAFKQVTELRNQDCKSAKGAVNVEPQTLGFGNIGKGGNSVAGSCGHRPDSADNREGLKAGIAILSNGSLQVASVNAAIRQASAT